MKHYHYRLTDFLNEESLDDKGTKQFYDGDSDTGVQAGKPDAKESKGDYNLRQVANGIAAAVKSHSDVKAKLDAKNLEASGKLKFKLGKHASLAGDAEIEFLTGKADITIPIKGVEGSSNIEIIGYHNEIPVLSNLGDTECALSSIKVKNKEVDFLIKDLNVTSPQNIYGKDIEGKFIDPVSNKEVKIGVNIDPTKEKYSFVAGQKKKRFAFDVTLDIDKDKISPGVSIGFDSQDFIPSKFAPMVKVGLEYGEDSTGYITATKGFKTRKGSASISAQVRASQEEKAISSAAGAAAAMIPDLRVGANVGITYTPDNKKNISGFEKSAAKHVKKYTDIDDVSKTARLKDEDGETKLGKDLESAAVKIQKTASSVKENRVLMTKNELSIVINSILSF